MTKRLFWCSAAAFFIHSTISCKIANPVQNDENAKLSDIKMSFPVEKFPWKEGLTSTQERQKALATMNLVFSATKTSQGANCTEVGEKTIGFNTGDNAWVLTDVKLTVQCEYKMLLKIADSGNTYFQTADASLKQVIPADGLVRGYKLCLMSAGSYFDQTKKVANCVSSSQNSAGDTDVTIDPSISGNNNSSSGPKPKPQVPTGTLSPEQTLFLDIVKAHLLAEEAFFPEMRRSILTSTHKDKTVAGEGIVSYQSYKYPEADSSYTVEVALPGNTRTDEVSLVYDTTTAPPKIELYKKVKFKGTVSKIDGKINLRAIELQEID